MEQEVLQKLDQAYDGSPGDDFQKVGKNDIRYNFFPDLDDGYLNIADSRVHLYRSNTQWAIVFELSGYHNRQLRFVTQLFYIGNCIIYPIVVTEERKYISNVAYLPVIEDDHLHDILAGAGTDDEKFELVSSDATSVIVKGINVDLDQSSDALRLAGFELEEAPNGEKLLRFENLLRLLTHKDRDIICAHEDEIKAHLPEELTKIIVIRDFHYESRYEDDRLPGSQEAYQLMARVIAENDATQWRPSQPSNNHWKNWESGSM